MVMFLLVFICCQESKAPKCIDFDGSNYCAVWSGKGDGFESTEFIKTDETLKKWQSMLTLRTYPDAKELKDVLPKYVASIKPFLSQKPEILSREVPKFSNEVILHLWLRGPKHVEHVTHVFYEDKGRVRSAFFSVKKKLGKKIVVSDVMEKRWGWVSELFTMDKHFQPM